MDQTGQHEGTFGHDLKFMNRYKKAIVLTASDNGQARAMIIPAYQGRVLTSTAGGDAGNSYGWINYALIESGVHQPHMNAFGGEERFWLSPEGGQFSVFFKKGDAFDFKNWQTPPCIDTMAFKIVESDGTSVSLEISAEVENHSGHMFVIDMKRKISMLDKASILRTLSIASLGNCKSVAYESNNEIVNKGSEWNPETGMLGIWLLGMFRPTGKTVIIAPFSKQHSQKLLLTDDYFGAIPADRISFTASAVLLKADGKFRSKIGLAANSALNVAGSYDAEKGVLTIIQYDVERVERYLKSTWEIHEDPYNGDLLNAYNDGKLADGTQMGPFYELESNSFTRPLKEGESLKHRQRTYHFEGDPEVLDDISQKVLGLKVSALKNVFN